jgi:ABC-type multidrug transport system ATPase subunit
LFKRKSNRAILMCTHFMDEADIVADRKAMLTKGQLVCVGSSAYLKNVYNTGYTLTIEKKSPLERSLLEAWFSARKLEVEFVRNNEKIVEFQFMSKVIWIRV